MRPAPGLRARLSLGALACAGVAVTHVLAFSLSASDPAARHDLLVATGHGWWAHMGGLSLGLLVVALVGVLTPRAWGDGALGGARGYLYTVTRLALLQGGAFVALEAVERSTVGHPLAEILAEPVVLIGLVVQLVVAVVAAFLVAVLRRVVVRLAAFLRPTLRPPRRILPRPGFARVPIPALALAVGGPTLRGPPTRS